MSTPVELSTYAAPHVLPALLAFSVGSRQSLRTYLAVKATEDAPPVSDDDKKRLRRLRAFATFTTMAVIFGAEFALLSKQDETGLDILFRVLFGILYQMAFFGTLVDLTKAFNWAVFRSPGRILHFRPAKGTVSFPRVALALGVATALNVSAYFQYHAAVGSALTFALVYRVLAKAHTRSFSIRNVALGMLVYLALVFTLSGFLVAYLIKTYQEDKGGNLVDDEGNVIIPAHPDEASFASKPVMDFIYLLFPSIYAMVPSLLIAGCYRFDYQNHIEENPSATAVNLEVIEPRPCFAKFLGRGVIVPTASSSVSSKFYKPYFATALRSWFLAQLVTFGLFYAALPLDADILKSSAYDLTGLSLAIPFMIVGLAITASIRGEGRKLWMHREEWTPKETPANGEIALGEEDVEEQLPEYEAPVVAADEKKPLLAEVVVVEEAAPGYEIAHLDSKA